MPRKRKPDRRVQRTRKVLHEALHTLITEKPYEAIVVKEILGRANVGRSTFYAHFRGKDELLAAGIHEMLDAARTTEPGLLWFSLPIFEHLERHLDHATTPAPQTRLHEQLQQVLAGIVADDLRRMRRGRTGSRLEIPLQLLSEYVAATFIQVLNWWIAAGRSQPAKAANDVFRALVLPSLVPQGLAL